MKRLLLLLPVLFIMMMSCEVIVIEEPVPVHGANDHFIGFYDVEEYDITSGLYTEYNMNIVKERHDSYTIYIRNFFGVGIEVVGEVSGVDVYIPAQTVDGYFIEGDGYIQGNELVLNYAVNDQFDSYNRTHYYEAVAWR